MLVRRGALLGFLLVACGSRTGLFVSEDDQNPVVPGRDGGTDGPTPPRDSGLDTLPPIDVGRPDVDRTGCKDPSETFVYLVSEENELFSFYPPELRFTSIGTLRCPAAAGETPYSMAVDRRGTAYVVFTDGTLFRVNTANAGCTATTYTLGQLPNWTTFGMGFVSESGGPAERLFVAEGNFDGDSLGLATIDTTPMRLSFVAPFEPALPRLELTGTGDGRLFAFWPNKGILANGSNIAEIDKRTGEVLARNSLTVSRSDDAFAFAFWGGDFWIFSGQTGSTTVSRFRPSDNSTTTVATRSSTIVGAGVSTCAPQ